MTYYNIKRLPSLLAILLSTSIFFVINNSTAYTIGTIIYWIIGMAFSIRKFRERFAMLAFNIGFFLFLIGGFSIFYLIEHNFSYFSNSIASVRHTTMSLMICMAIFNAFGIFCEGEQNKIYCHKPAVNKHTYKFIVSLLIISFVCKFTEESIITTITQATSYAESESIASGLPVIVTSFSSLYYITLFLFWSLFPDKKGTLLSIFSLIIIEIIILVSGERGEPISLVMTVVFYMFMRQKRGYTDIIISKKIILAIIVLLPFGISSLQKLSYSRVGREYDADFSTSIKEFFDSQGGSVKIIANGYDLKKTISTIGGNSFVLGPVRNYFKNNIFTRLLFNKEKQGRSLETALSGDSYIETYGYAYSPYTFFKGVGSGSTYVAEVYQDGGYVFLIIINVLFALLTSFVDRYNTNSLVTNAILLNIFRYIPLIPRGLALQWLVSTFAIQNILLFILIYYLNRNSR